MSETSDGSINQAYYINVKLDINLSRIGEDATDLGGHWGIKQALLK